MRYPASEKIEIIRLVEQSHLPARRTLDKLGIPKITFYRWYDRYQAGGPEALEDRSPKPSRVWNRIPEPVREQIKDLALKESELSPRELAVRFTDTEKYFVSEASVYRILKSYDLITSPAYVVLSAADEFKDKTTRSNQLWQTDFTYLKVIGWGWFYLSTILDDYSRYIIAWKLCTTMKTGDVTDTLNLALQASGCDQATVLHKPRLLSPSHRYCVSTAGQGTTVPVTSLATWPNGSAIKVWVTFVEPRTIPKPKARSLSAFEDKRLSGEGALASDSQEPFVGETPHWGLSWSSSCLKITICPATSRNRSTPSSITIITGATTRACRISRLLTSTSVEARPS